jgi:hypothetical protein
VKPPKPENRKGSPRYKHPKEKRLSTAVEAARKLTDLEISASQMQIERYFELDDRSFAVLRGANVENALEIAITRRIKSTTVNIAPYFAATVL